MPREGDQFGQQRGGDDLHSPLRGLLDFTDPIDEAAKRAGPLIIQGIVSFLENLTGLDFSDPGAFLQSLLDLPMNLLEGLDGEGSFLSWLSDIVGLLGDPLGLGSGNPILPGGIEDIPILGPVIDYVLSLPSEIWNFVTEFISKVFAGDVGGAAGMVIDWLGNITGLTGDGGVLGFIEDIGSNIFGIFGDPTGSGSIWDTILTCVGGIIGDPLTGIIDTISGIVQFVMGFINGGVPGGGLLGSIMSSDCTNILRVPAGALTLGTFSPSSLISDLFSIFSNPDGSSLGSLFDAITKPIWNFINCGGLFGDSFTLSQNITGLIGNPAGLSFGSIIDGITGFIMGICGPVCDFLLGAQDFSPSQIISSLFGNPDGLSTGSLWDTVVNCVMGLLSPVFDFLLGAQDFSISQIITSIFGNPGGLSTGSLFDTVVNWIMGIVSPICEFLFGTGDFSISQALTSLFGNPGGLSTGSLFDTVISCVMSICGPICDFLVGAQGFSISSVLTSLFGNPGGLSTGSLWDTVINFIKNLCTCGGLLSTVSELIQGVLGIFSNPTGFSLGSIVDAITNCIKSILGLAGGFLDIITGLFSGNLSGLLNFIGSPLDPSMLFGVNSPLSALIKGITSMIGLGDIGGGTGGLFGTLTNFGNDFMSMFGNPGNLGTGIPGIDLKAFEQIPLLGQLFTMGNNSASTFLHGNLTPAGALASFTQLPAHLFGMIMPTGDSNMAPPFTAETIDGQDLWTWDDTLDAIETTADGTVRPLLGVAFPVKADQNVQGGIDAIWSGLTGTGLAIQVGIYAYAASTANANLPGAFIGQVAAPSGATITNPAASGSTTLSGKFVMPVGTKFARLLLQVESNVLSGTVAFKNPLFAPKEVLDSGLLGNIGGIPQLFPGSVGGIQGINDLPDTWSHIMDGLGTSFTPDGSVSGINFAQLFGLAQNTRQDASTALTTTVTNTQTLGIRNNEDISAALNPTAESSFNLTELPHGSTLPTISLAAGNAIATPITMKRSAIKGSVEFMASGASPSDVHVNLYGYNTTTGAKTKLWASPDVSGSIPVGAASAANYVPVAIPTVDQIPVNPGDVVMAEIANNGGSAINVVYKQQPQPNKAGIFPANFGATRVLASTGGVSPSSLTDSQHTTNGNTPWASIGILDLPAGFNPPEEFHFETPGAHTATAPAWWRPGVDFVDRVALGAGGGAGGSNGAGFAGGSTTIAATGETTVTATGGAGGASGVSFNGADRTGHGPGNYTPGAKSYFGGPDVTSTVGGNPGGGGAGANYWSTYNDYGGVGGNWASDIGLQTTETSFSITVGTAGAARTGGNATGFAGDDGAAWVRFYQNPAVP